MPDDIALSRRRFLGYAIGGVAGAIALGYAVPVANYIVRPALTKEDERWSMVGSTAELNTGQPASLNFVSHVKVGWQDKTVEHDIWAVKQEDGSVTVFSPTCPHLGCGYRWDAVDGVFRCPCHASTFNIKGTVLGGPAPRDLDTLPSRVEDGVLYVVFKKYRLGVTTKVEA